jgi:NMD protein affecting ribosome stability and mRNA decay
MSLEVCYRCGADSDITYTCQHTNERKMCAECYQFIHWTINNNNDDQITKTQ